MVIDDNISPILSGMKMWNAEFKGKPTVGDYFHGRKVEEPQPPYTITRLWEHTTPYDYGKGDQFYIFMYHGMPSGPHMKVFAKDEAEAWQKALALLERGPS